MRCGQALAQLRRLTEIDPRAVQPLPQLVVTDENGKTVTGRRLAVRYLLNDGQF